uniref:Uncharacterized protein n=1 Tax=Loigolactobacillus rennini TaxID=238013 RepID=A0A1K2I7N3_9LACO|nr:hypothetical protein LREN565_1515 [Loigolactobacillus rennini]
MRILQRVIASLRYHWRYGIFLSIISALFLISSLTILLLRNIQGQALRLFEQRLNSLARSAQFIDRLSLLQQLVRVRQTIINDAQIYFTILFWGFAVVILMLNSLTLWQRQSEFNTYQLAGQNGMTSSLQFALENLLLFSLAAGIIAIIMLFSQTIYLNQLALLSQHWFNQKLPAKLTTLQLTQHGTAWTQFNQLFHHQLTTFNGHLLLFDQGTNSNLFTIDFNRLFWALTWRSGLLTFIISYLSAMVYNWRLKRQNAN